MKKILSIAVVLFLVSVGSLLYLRSVMYYKTGSTDRAQTDLTVVSGMGAEETADLLFEKKLIPSRWLFLYYLKANDLSDKIKAGDYVISSGLTIPEIASILTDGKTVRRDIRITFPEGWTLEEMARRLKSKGFDGEEFLRLAQNPPEDLLNEFDFLHSLPKDASLEGYLFPDTYLFLPETSARQIIRKMLQNFDRKTAEIRADLRRKNMSLHEAVIMASLVEGEVHKSEERPIVAGIFYNRLKIGMPLQSDATLDYIFGEAKIKHTLEETKVDSPYNTYQNPGLPPGPIGNPGLDALRAAVHPQKTDYMYFLNNAETGQTVFSRTFEEHVRNKARNGL